MPVAPLIKVDLAMEDSQSSSTIALSSPRQMYSWFKVVVQAISFDDEKMVCIEGRASDDPIRIASASVHRAGERRRQLDMERTNTQRSDL